MSVAGDKALYYLAAAVSDFFIPSEKMVSVTRSLEGNKLIGPTKNNGVGTT